MMWTLKALIQFSSQTQKEINGKWVPCRPDNCAVESFSMRVKSAWAVFTGRAEAFTWPENQ